MENQNKPVIVNVELAGMEEATQKAQQLNTLLQEAKQLVAELNETEIQVSVINP